MRIAGWTSLRYRSGATQLLLLLFFVSLLSPFVPFVLTTAQEL